MALNRRQRRARKDRRPHASDTPQQQMRDFLRAPGKLHIVQLPDEKSFVVKVTEREMPLFLTICQQLRAVLGQCDAIPATPVDASVADAQTIARQTANDPQRIADAQRRQNEAEQARAAASAGKATADEFAADLAASIARHPAGKKRSGGRHAKPEPENTFDKFAATQDKVRAASIELAAAQDAAARAQEAADAANARLAEVYERTGEIHNQRVLGAFTEAAGQAIAEHEQEPSQAIAEHEQEPRARDFIDTEVRRSWAGDGPYIEARATEGPGSEPIWPQYDITGPGKHRIDYTGTVDTTPIDQARQAAIDEALRQQQNESCMCPRSFADDTRNGTHPRCPQHGPDHGKPPRVIADNPQA